jgi:effector-binding domain-containing protein
MRWLLGLIAVISAMAGAIGAAGYYFLSPDLALTRSIEIDRPRATVYALISDLRTFNEFSPWYARDPQARYVFSGPESGVGQSARWESAALGAGDQAIVAATENQSVRYRLNSTARGGSFSVIAIEPAGSGVKVSWSLSAQCPREWRFVLCRYGNLFAAPTISQDFDDGLARLKTLAETVPAIDFEGLAITETNAAARDFAYVENATSLEQSKIRTAMSQAFALVEGVMTENQIARAGPPLAITVKIDPQANLFAFKAGVPFSGPAPASDPRVRVGKTPEGAAIKAVHVGPYDAMKETYARIDAYMRAHRIEAAGGPWEVYLEPPNGANPAAARTEIWFPVKPRRE